MAGKTSLPGGDVKGSECRVPPHVVPAMGPASVPVTGSGGDPYAGIPPRLRGDDIECVDTFRAVSQAVIAGLDPAIHDLLLLQEKTWITGTSPVMTIVGVESSRSSSRFNFQTATFK